MTIIIFMYFIFNPLIYLHLFISTEMNPYDNFKKNKNSMQLKLIIKNTSLKNFLNNF